MRVALSLVGGVVAGAAVAVALLYALALPSTRSGRVDDGLWRLAPGASSWAAVPGAPKGECSHLWAHGDKVVMAADGPPRQWDAATGAWSEPAAEPPTHPYPPAGTTARWFFLDDGTSWSLPEGDCRVYAEPLHEPLPRFATCPEKTYELEAFTRLDDGARLAVLYDKAVNKHRAWRLATGADAWADLGPLELPTTAGDLVAGAGGRALFVSATGVLLKLEGTRWAELPPEKPRRYAQKAALLADGSVLSCGGQRDLDVQNALLSVGLPLGALLLVVLGAVFLKARPLAFVLGGVVGVALVAAAVVYVFVSAGFH